MCCKHWSSQSPYSHSVLDGQGKVLERDKHRINKTLAEWIVESGVGFEVTTRSVKTALSNRLMNVG